MLVVRQVGVWASLAAVFALSASASAAEPRAVTVEPNRVYDLPIQSGDQLALQIAADNTKPWLLRVSRVGTDISVAVNESAAFTHPLTRFSSDYVYVGVGAAATTFVVLTADEPGGPLAQVELELINADDLPAVVSSVADWNREGALAFAEHTEEGRLRALAAYQRVERVLFSTEKPILKRIRTDAIHAQGEIAFFNADAALTTNRLRTAADAYRALELGNDEAAVLNSLGIWYMDRRERDAAYAAYDAAWAATQNPIARGQIQYNRCLVAVNTQFFKEAENCLATAEQLTAASGDSKFRSFVRNAQAGVYSMRGEPTKALPILLDSLSSDSGLPWYRLGTNYNNIAIQYAQLGDTPAALDYYHRALETNRSTGRSSKIALNLRNLSIEYFKLGDLARARRYLVDAVELSRSLGDDANEIAAEIALAKLDRSEGHLESAWDRLNTLRSRIVDDPEIEFDIAIQQGYTALQLNDLADATDTISRIAALTEIAEPNFHNQVHALRIQAAIAERSERPSSATGYLEDAVAVAETMRNPLILGTLHSELARHHLALDNLESAEEHARTAQRVLRPIRGRLASLDLRANWGGETASFNDALIGIAMRRHTLSPTRGYDADALHSVISARAQTLAETLEATSSTAQANSELLERRRELLLQVSRFADADRSVTVQIPLPDLLLALDRLDQELAQANPRRADISGVVAPDVDDLRAALPANSALITVYLGETHGFVWNLDASGLKSYAIDDLQGVRQAAAATAQHLRDRRDVRAPLATLSAAILPEELANDVERLYISVEGELSYMPLGLLADPSGKVLVDHVAIINVPTPAILAGSGKEAPDSSEPLSAEVFSDPVFALSDSRFDGAQDALDADVSRASVLDNESWNRLGYTAREATELAAVIGEERVVAYAGFGATRETLLTVASKDSDILHLATHGIVNSGRPEFTGLMLSRFDADGNNIDGFVGMRDIYSLEIQAPLVVLSACETAIGREVRGEGLLGLSRAFMYAGADEVVASLWQVSDSATATLMGAFYENYARSRDAASALASAKRTVKRNPRWRHPYYWAGFVLYGR